MAPMSPMAHGTTGEKNERTQVEQMAPLHQLLRAAMYMPCTTHAGQGCACQEWKLSSDEKVRKSLDKAKATDLKCTDCGHNLMEHGNLDTLSLDLLRPRVQNFVGFSVFPFFFSSSSSFFFPGESCANPVPFDTLLVDSFVPSSVLSFDFKLTC